MVALYLGLNLAKTKTPINYMGGIITENFTQRTTPNTVTWNSVCYGEPSGNPLFVAVSTTGTNRVMTSPDGVIWTSRSASQSNPWQSVVWAGGTVNLFVAVANSGTNRVMTSPDGITWTNRNAIGTTGDWRSVAWSGSRLVSVAFSNTTGSAIMYSDDGINWNASTVPSPIVSSNARFTKVHWAGNFGCFIAVSNGDDFTIPAYCIKSTDGITWTVSSFGIFNTISENLTSIASNNGVILIGGDSIIDISPRLWISKDGGNNFTLLDSITDREPASFLDLLWIPHIQIFLGVINSTGRFYKLISIIGDDFVEGGNTYRAIPIADSSYQPTSIAYGSRERILVGVYNAGSGTLNRAFSLYIGREGSI